MAHGPPTTQVARLLQQDFEPIGLDVLHDHKQMGVDPPDKLGKIRSWFGSIYKSDAMLADLDIAVVSRHTGKVSVLIEIEETTDKPKAILGDVLATLLGNSITFQGKRHLHVGPWTTLVIMTHNTNSSHLNRLLYLEEQSNQLRTHLSTPNASIGRIILDAFQDAAELEHKLRVHIKIATEDGQYQ